MIEHSFRFAFLCLPLLASVAAGSDTDGLGDTPDDFLTLWRTFSEAGRQTAPVEATNADAVYPWLAQPSSGAGVPPVVPPSPLDPAFYLVAAPSANNAEASPINPWEVADNKPRKISQKSQGLFGSLDTKTEVTDTPTANVWDEPSWKRAWQTDNSWQMGLTGPLSVFGQVGANSDEAGQSNMKVSGRTGLACKVPTGSPAEVTLRSGPGVSYTDPLHPLHTTGRSDWLVEVQARCPLLLGIGLEYQGSALPSLTPLQQDTINQDLRLAMQIGSATKIKLGAKRQWSGVPEQRAAWTDNTQLYLGLELSH